MNNFVFTFSSTFRAFYRNFKDDAKAFNTAVNKLRLSPEGERNGVRKSLLVTVSQIYKSKDFTSSLKRRGSRDALIIHGTWDDEAEHSWWDFEHEMYRKSVRRTFCDDMHWNLHGTSATWSEFGLTTYSLDSEFDLSVWRVLQELCNVLYLDAEDLGHKHLKFDVYKYTNAILSLKGQSIMESAWDYQPNLLSGLTAAKYVSMHTAPACFALAVLITTAELLRSVGRSVIVGYADDNDPEVANRFQDLLEIGDNTLGRKW